VSLVEGALVPGKVAVPEYCWVVVSPQGALPLPEGCPIADPYCSGGVLWAEVDALAGDERLPPHAARAAIPAATAIPDSLDSELLIWLIRNLLEFRAASVQCRYRHAGSRDCLVGSFAPV